MTKHFEILSTEDYDLLKETVAIITLYIAGADGKIETKELLKAERIAKIRSYDEANYDLSDFFKQVGIDFHEKLESYVHDLPENTEERTAILVEKLEKVDVVLKQLHPELGAALYKSYRSFAEHVAKASGGFLGIFSIGPKEAEYMKLEMIDPITWTSKHDDDTL